MGTIFLLILYLNNINWLFSLQCRFATSYVYESKCITIYTAMHNHHLSKCDMQLHCILYLIIKMHSYSYIDNSGTIHKK